MGTAVYLTKACGVVAVIFLIGTFFFPRQIMAVLTNEEELIVLGGEYLRVIGISYVLSSIAQTFLAIMKNCNAVNISTLINSVMVILNIILNAVFIFGLFGCPEMGILWTKSLNCR
nr:MATE family efflux transporter [uncultured Blautia sp.]